MTAADCAYCQAMVSKKNLVYEDDKVCAFLVGKPAALGHMVVLPRAHALIIEQIPDEVFAHLFVTVNRLSMAMFEATNAEGSNIVINNGVADGKSTTHSLVHIIPRRAGDGLDMSWQPRQVSEEVLTAVEGRLRDEAKQIVFDVPKVVPKEIPIETPPPAQDHLVRHLHRIP